MLLAMLQAMPVVVLTHMQLSNARTDGRTHGAGGAGGWRTKDRYAHAKTGSESKRDEATKHDQ